MKVRVTILLLVQFVVKLVVELKTKLGIFFPSNVGADFQPDEEFEASGHTLEMSQPSIDNLIEHQDCEALHSADDEYLNPEFDPFIDDPIPDDPIPDDGSDEAIESLLSYLGFENDEVYDEEYFVTEHDVPKGDRPLYSGARITLHESLVAILTTVMRFKLSGACLKGVLDLMYLHMPKTDNVFKRSLSFFKTYFLCMQGPKEYKRYCSQCFDELALEPKCPKCPGSKVSYLVKLSLVHQLQALFSREGFYEKLDFSASSGSYSDIKNGKLYQDQVRQGRLGRKDQTSFMLYADGAEVFGSTKLSAWLTYLSINELPYQERYKRENVMVPVVWIGAAKPPNNIIFNALHSDLSTVAQGVSIRVNNEERNITGFVLDQTGDTPARAAMLNMVQFNGKYPCQRCEQEGEPRAGCPGVRLFPSKPEEMTPRTKSCMEEYASKGTDKEPCMGVKGPSAMNSIMPDYVRGTAIDPMHQLYGGCGKKILQLLVSTKKEHKKFSISKFLPTLNSRLVSIKPPFNCPRIPRSIDLIANWKMNELKWWLLDYSLPVLDEVLPNHYLEHHASLVAAGQMLDADVVTEESALTAENLLKEYMSQFRDFYDLNAMSINFHLLLHLAEVCRDLGAQWNYTCFPPESLNGVILNMVHGTRWVELQVPASIQMCLGLPDLIQNLPDSEAKEFCSKIMNSYSHSGVRMDGLVLLGKFKALIDLPENILNFLLTQETITRRASTFASLRRGKCYYVSSLCNFKSRDSTVAVFMTNDGNTHVGLILTFIREYTCKCENLACHCKGQISVILKKFEETRRFKTLLPNVYVPNVGEYKLREEFVLVPAQSLNGVCVKMTFNNKIFISKPTNLKEWE